MQKYDSSFLFGVMMLF